MMMMDYDGHDDLSKEDDRYIRRLRKIKGQEVVEYLQSH